MTAMEHLLKSLMRMIGVTDAQSLAMKIVEVSGISPQQAQEAFQRINAMPVFVQQAMLNFDQRLKDIEATQLLLCQHLGITKPLTLEASETKQEVQK